MARGDFRTATCCECGEEFGYVFTYKNRVVCDKSICRYNRKLKQNQEAKRRLRGIPLTRHGLQCPQHEDTKGFRPKPKVKRGSWCTRHDLQHAPTHDFLKQVNAILRGERGLV